MLVEVIWIITLTFINKIMVYFIIQTIFRNPREVKPYTVPSSDRCNLPAAAIHASSDTVVIVDVNAPAAHVAQHKWQPNTPDGQGWPFLFQHGKTAVSTSSGSFMRMFKGSAGSGSDDWHFPQALAFATSGIRSSAIVSITCDKEIITGKYCFYFLFFIFLFFFIFYQPIFLISCKKLICYVDLSSWCYQNVPLFQKVEFRVIILIYLLFSNNARVQNSVIWDLLSVWIRTKRILKVYPCKASSRQSTPKKIIFLDSVEKWQMDGCKLKLEEKCESFSCNYSWKIMN